ncbi:class I SAM-dependent methyltransferase [Flavobacterium caseinilyticum]|uniref:Methyltransferase domain-containing protein n=1 Tax=Flavobacterium caseinilyticum TaxID=2541732 RepID=A0A4R5AYM9_9FLAO|nr:class I SAM-dependent methyltransferase [Flavobacterium caseinilyticum]TDD77259.1 methyltransferase domain-containing protein [Flavobacterium caseinilyticum]
MKNFWNDRYSEKEYVYGEEPNVFFAEQLQQLAPGKIILPCEGEGRNAVYSAGNGWEVHAFDTSIIGKSKAIQLAARKEVSINYTIEDAVSVTYEKNSIDAVAFIYAHFPASIRKKIHQKAITWLKPGGKIIIEAFTPEQLQNNSGGPKEVSMLYTKEMLLEDFEELTCDVIETQSVALSEGEFHKGKAAIIRFIGTKK